MAVNAYIPCAGCGGAMSPFSRVHTREETLFSCGRCGLTIAVADQLLAQSALWTPEPEPEPPKPTAPEPEKTIHGSVIGYRAWRIRDWQLYGTGVNRAWAPGVNEATCDAGDHDSNMNWILNGFAVGKHPAPAIGCHCGITCLARFVPEDAHWTNAAVYGAIEAWSDETVTAAEPGDVADATGVLPKPEHDHAGGRFILHGNGFRAQFGKIVLLAVDDEWPAAKKAAVRALAREHEADVCKHAHLEDAAKEHGQLVPDELLEWARELDPPETAALSPGYLPAPMWLSSYGTVIGIGSSPSFSIGLPQGPRFATAKTRTKKGICQNLGYPGPPADPTQKFSRGNRVRDSKGATWRCVKGGKPGLWEAEEA